MAVKLTPKTFLLFGCMWLPHKWVLLEICHLNLCFIGWKAWSQKFPHFRMYGTQFPTKLQVIGYWDQVCDGLEVQDDGSRKNCQNTEVFHFYFDFYQLCRGFYGEPRWHRSMNFVGSGYSWDPLVTSPNIYLWKARTGNTLFLASLPNIYRKRWILWDLWKVSIRRTPVSFKVCWHIFEKPTKAFSEATVKVKTNVFYVQWKDL